MEHKAYLGSFFLVDGQIVNLLLLLVHTPGFNELISIGAGAACVIALLRQNVEAVCRADRCLLALTVGLPKADVIHQPVGVALNSLLALLGSPYPDSVTDKPLHNKGRLVRNAAYTVKHKNKQNIKLLLQGVVLNHLYLIPVFSSDLVAGDTFLLELANNSPAVLLGKLPAAESLHGYIRLVVCVMVKLLGRRYAVEAQYPCAVHDVLRQVKPPSCFLIETITCESA